MNTTDTDTYRAFADRVRANLAETLPATFHPQPDAPCAKPWCIETGTHLDHTSRRVSLPTNGVMPAILTAYVYADDTPVAPELSFDLGGDDWREGITSEQLRAETNRVRAHLLRLDALADEFDAITEGGTATTTAVVLIGRGSAGDFDVDVWPVTGMSYTHEAVYNPGRISLKDAETRVRGLLDERNVQVARFLNTDTLDANPPYVPPTEYEDRERVVCAGGRGAIINAVLLDPRNDEFYDGGSMTLSVYPEPGSDADLDATGATRLIADLDQLRPKLCAMRDVLAAQENSAALADVGPVAAASLADAAADLAVQAVSASLAGLQTNPRDVAQRLHRAIDNAQGWHLAEVGDHSEVVAYADSRFATAVDAMADAVHAAERSESMADALRSALDMVIGEAR